MSIKTTILGLLTPVCTNTWAIELPSSPAWPAVVFDIDTDPEDQWTLGGGYDQHVINVVVLAPTLSEIEALLPPIRAALNAHPQSMGIEDEGDAEYERSPQVYGYYVTARFRTPQY